MGHVYRCIIIVSKFIVSVDSDALLHTGLHVFTRQRLWPSQYVHVLHQLFLSLVWATHSGPTQASRQYNRQKQVLLLLWNRYSAHQNTPHVYLPSSMLSIYVGVERYLAITCQPGRMYQTGLSVPLSPPNAIAEIITNRFPPICCWLDKHIFQKQNPLI